MTEPTEPTQTDDSLFDPDVEDDIREWVELLTKRYRRIDHALADALARAYVRDLREGRHPRERLRATHEDHKRVESSPGALEEPSHD